MRDIRSKISQKHGIDFSNEQIHELAARRLEAILDPRTIKPALLDELRRGAAAQPAAPASATAGASFEFEDNSLYYSHRGFLRVMRRLLNPLLMLFLNPTPLIRALHAQSRINAEAAARDAERDRRQAEWNGLHYEILQRLVTEVSRVSVDVQSLSMRVESLGAKVDFNERRVRGLEGSLHTTRSGVSTEPATVVNPSDVGAGEPQGDQVGEGARRRRRRRRGRRTGMPGGDAGIGAPRPAPMEHQADAASGEPAIAAEPADPDGGEPTAAVHPPAFTRSESRDEPRSAPDVPGPPPSEPGDQ